MLHLSLRMIMRWAGCVSVSVVACGCAALNEAVSKGRWDAEYFKPSARVYFDTGKDDSGEVDLYKDGAVAPAVDFIGIGYGWTVKESGAASEASEELLAAEKNELAAATKARDAGTDAARDAAGAGRASAWEKETLERDVHEAQDAVRKTERALDRDRLDEARRAELRAKGTKVNGDWVLGPRVAFGMTAPAGGSDGDDASGAPVVYVSASVFADFYKQSKSRAEEAEVGVRLEFGWMRGYSADEDFTNSDDDAWFVGMSVFLD